ncbi:MAG: hypothetical protein U0838_17130 [Chloroflexota bacterium]
MVERVAELDPQASMDPGRSRRRGAGDEDTAELLDAVGDEFPTYGDGPRPTRQRAARPDRQREPRSAPAAPARGRSAAPRGCRSEAMATLEAYHAARLPIGPNGETLVELLRAPARA